MPCPSFSFSASSFRDKGLCGKYGLLCHYTSEMHKQPFLHWYCSVFIHISLCFLVRSCPSFILLTEKQYVLGWNLRADVHRPPCSFGKWNFLYCPISLSSYVFSTFSSASRRLWTATEFWRAKHTLTSYIRCENRLLHPSFC